jgi:Short C-terminal domain
VSEPAHPLPRAQRPSRTRRLAVVLLIFLAALLLMVTSFAVWVDRVALNTDVFTDTSGELIEDDDIRRAIAVRTIDEIYDSVDVEEELEGPLPEDVETLAGPTSATLRELGPQIVERALGRAELRRLWRRTLQEAHEALVLVLEERSGTISSEEGVVTLDLGDIVIEAADRIGVSDSVQRRIDEDAGRVEILESDDLDTAQDAFRLLNASAWFLPLLTFAVFGLALWLSRGRRRVTVRAIGIAIFLSGLLGLLAVNLTGWYLVRSLADERESRDAGGSAWEIVTELLRASFRLQILVGLLFLLAAWLAGPSPLALQIRRALAPLLSQRRYGYAVLGLLALVLLLTGQTTDFADLLAQLVLFGLLVGWIEWMRRQTRAEFPDVTAPVLLSGAGTRLAEWLQSRRTATAGGGNPRPLDLTGRLQQLADMHARGELTDAEYAAAKARILAGD